jgi:hypothetical protein
MRYNLKELNYVKGKEQYQVKMSNRCAAMENLVEQDYDDDDDDDDDDVGINKAWESTGENMKVSATKSRGYCTLKQQKSWFDEEYSNFLYQRKQAKL